MIATIHKWGNSFAVRLKKDEVERLGLGEGALVDVSVRPVPVERRIDISDRPTFHDPDPLLSQHVDDILYGESDE